MRLRFALLSCAVACIPELAFGQAYILRPGPRGFDPKLNPYGATEQPATATVGEGDRFNPSRTTVRVEILMVGDGAALDAQHWSRILAEAGYPARIRQPIRDDRAEVTETTRGPLRFVTVIGGLGARGNLVFPQRTFTPGEAAELKDWLDDLKTYGAQGSPEGQPLWGLSRSQFEQFYKAMSKPVEAEVAGLPLADALAAMSLPGEHPLRWNAAAKESLDESGRPSGVSRSVAGLTTGTALAFVLNEYGLGFRPERTPEGSVALAVEPLPTELPIGDAAVSVLWPVGWVIEEQAVPERSRVPVKDKDAVPPNRVQLARSLFTMTEVDVRNLPLPEALAVVEREAGIAILLDRPAIAAAGIDLAKSRVAVPAGRTSWNLVLRTATFAARLRHEVRRDEAGLPLVWVTAMRRGR